MTNLKEISTNLSTVESAYYSEYTGRAKTIRLIILSLISKQHIYMISPPGTGKTMMENVARSFNMSTYYYLYNYDTKLEDILYNPIIKKEKISDTDEKIIISYELKNPGVGTTDIHFADEMFKAPTSILNALLSIMNERRLTVADKDYKVPLWTLIAASNELPDNAEALIDRFLFRSFLRYLPKELWVDYLVNYWSIHNPSYRKVKINVPKSIIEEANKILFNVDVFSILDDYTKILDKLEERNITISDRRKGRILQAISASAILAGRTTAEPEDLEVLIYTIPTNEEEATTVVKTVDEYLGGIIKTKEEIDNLIQQISSFIANLNNKSIDEITELANSIPRIRNKITTITFQSLQYKLEKLNSVVNEAENQIIEEIIKRGNINE